MVVFTESLELGDQRGSLLAICQILSHIIRKTQAGGEGGALGKGQQQKQGQGKSCLSEKPIHR